MAMFVLLLSVVVPVSKEQDEPLRAQYQPMRVVTALGIRG
jgi:hypothetical protein